jgi:hypothetical protein
MPLHPRQEEKGNLTMQTFAMPVYVTVRARDEHEATELMAQAMMAAQGVPGVTYRRPLPGFAELLPELEPRTEWDKEPNQADQGTGA